MINAFNYLTLRELFLIRIRHFNHLDAMQQFKIMWAIDRTKRIIDKTRKNKSKLNFKDIDNQETKSVNERLSLKVKRNKITLGSRDSADIQANLKRETVDM